MNPFPLLSSIPTSLLHSHFPPPFPHQKQHRPVQVSMHPQHDYKWDTTVPLSCLLIITKTVEAGNQTQGFWLAGSSQGRWVWFQTASWLFFLSGLKLCGSSCASGRKAKDHPQYQKYFRMKRLVS